MYGVCTVYYIGTDSFFSTRGLLESYQKLPETGQSDADRAPLFVLYYFWRFMKGGGKKKKSYVAENGCSWTFKDN
jgi:hypothetical protein